jgi:hypothetical protein
VMVASSTKKKGRRGQQTSTEGAETPPSGASGSRPQTRGSAGQTPPPPAGRALTVPGQNPGGGSADPPPGVAQFEALVQALNTLPADTRRAISAHMGVPSATSAASQRYDEERMDNFYASCIQPFIPDDLRSDFDSVEWSDVGTLFSKVCHSLELRKPGEDEKIKDILQPFWYEQRLDTRSKPQPAHVLELFKKKPEAAAADKVYREIQDGPLRDLLRPVLHMGVRASKPDPPYSESPQTEVDSLRDELLKLKTEARAVSVLSFSLLSEIQASRRKLMWEVTGAKTHELGGVSLWTPDDAATLHRIVDHRDWQAKMLPRIAKPSGGRGRGNRTGRGGRRNDTRPSGGRSSEGRKDSESSTNAADAAAEPASATKATPRKTGPKKGSGKGKGK